MKLGLLVQFQPVNRVVSEIALERGRIEPREHLREGKDCH